MVLTSNRYLGPDIWLERFDQATGTEDIMKIISAKEAYCWQKENEKKIYL